MMKIKFTILLLSMIFGQAALAQTKSVSGNVTDASGIPIAGTTVLVAGTTNGTSSDFDGNFTLNNVKPTDQLVFSYIGFETKTILVGDETVINVTLNESQETLNEIVVVGYGATSRKLVTGAISSVKSEDITKTPIASVDQALQGNAAGVTVINSGSPGSAPQVQIRGLSTFGDSQPLYVVDGIVTDDISGLNPNDIKTMDVLKDASTAAIYGSRASNGVVMITTKNGVAGDTMITFDSYISSQTAPNKLDLLNAQQFETFAEETYGLPNRYTSDYASTQLNTDWQDQVFQTGIMTSNNIGVSGGSENATFNVSAGYLDQEGIIINTGFNRATIRANSEFKVGERLKIGEKIALSDSERLNEENAGGRTLVEHMIKSLPYTPVYNTNNPGGYGGTDTALDNGSDAENPVRVQSISNNTTESLQALGAIYASYEFVDGLTGKFQYGFDRRSIDTNILRPSFDEGINKRTAAEVINSKNSYNSNTYTGSLNYKKTFNDVHNIDALFVTEKFSNSWSFNSTMQENALSNLIPVVQGASQTTNSINEYELQSYIGRVNYNFNDKYMLSGSLRRDGSSAFGASNRWGTFPAMSLGWVISEESFMNKFDFISNMKLRGSWGKTGNDRVGSYAYSSGLVSGYNYVGFGLTGVSNYAAVDPNIKWEESTNTNIGLDFGFLSNALTLSLEYYNTDTEDLLVRVPVPASYGFGDPFMWTNGASSNTNGFEITAGYSHNKGGDFKWSANMNLATNNTEATKLNYNDFIEKAWFEGENLQRIEEGESLYYFYGYETDGLFQAGDDTSAQPNAATGDIRFVDQNGDGVINGDDNVKIGNPIPTLTYGVTLTANYKQFDASLFLSGVSGNDIYNTTKYDLEGMTRLFNAGTEVLNRWTPTNTNTTIPRYTADHSDNVNRSDRFIEDGSYAKLRNLSIGYSLSADTLDKISKGAISKFRFYAAGQNLLTFTNYSGYDPEIGGSTLGNDVGVDYGFYPQPKSFTVGLQVAF